MKTILVALTLIALGFTAGYLYNNYSKKNLGLSFKKFEEIVTQEKPKTEEKTETETEDFAKNWTEHKFTTADITIKYPARWYPVSDGIYNYDYSKVNSLNDPDLPDNSFKCVFSPNIKTEYSVLETTKIAETPLINYLKIKWNSNVDEGPSKAPGEITNIYTIHVNGKDEIRVQCIMFKGELTSDFKETLEQILSTAK